MADQSVRFTMSPVLEGVEPPPCATCPAPDRVTLPEHQPVKDNVGIVYGCRQCGSGSFWPCPTVRAAGVES